MTPGRHELLRSGEPLLQLEDPFREWRPRSHRVEGTVPVIAPFAASTSGDDESKAMENTSKLIRGEPYISKHHYYSGAAW